MFNEELSKARVGEKDDLVHTPQPYTRDNNRDLKHIHTLYGNSISTVRKIHILPFESFIVMMTLKM